MKSQLQSIQSLRGVAACLVVFHHVCQCLARESTAYSAINGFYELTEFGAAGVDIFFVISGFVMVLVTDPVPLADRSGGQFLAKRFVRILPLYWLYTSVFALMICVPGAFRNAYMPLHYLIGSYLLWPVPDAAGFLRPLLAPGWTLSYELLFYLIFALLIRRPMKTALLTMAGVFAVLIGWGLSAPQYGPEFEFMTSPLMSEFVLGMWAGLLYRRGKLLSPAVARWTIALATAAFLATIFFRVEMIWRPFCWGLPAFLLIWSVTSLEAAGHLRVGRLSLALGNASYSIYLTHVFCILVLGRVIRTRGTLGLGADGLILVAAVLCVIPGLLSYRWVEKPLIRLFSRKGKKPADRNEPGKTNEPTEPATMSLSSS